MPDLLSLAEAEAEAARSSPAALAIVASRGRWKPAPHLTLVNRKLVSAAVTGGVRVVIEIAPRHGKSEICSRYTPPWFLGNWPDKQVVVACYGDDFARLWGHRARDVMLEFGPAIFGCGVRKDSWAADDWGIDGHEGRMRSVGIGGGVTGRGADLLIIDDPVKDAAEANSQVVRDAHWEWWLSTAKPRLESRTASVVVLMTRWHRDDLAGRLIEQEGFEELRLPALAEEDDPLGRQPGEALWPERWSAETLEEIRDSPSGLYWFASLYQGRPTPRKGGMFDRDKAQIVDAIPSGCRMVRWWDLAAGKKAEKTDPDYTVGAKLAIASDRRMYIADVRRGRWRAKELEERVKNTALQDGHDVPVWFEQEPGSGGELYITGTLVPLLAGYPVHWMRSVGDKILRAEPWSSQWQAGNVALLAAPWNEALLTEHEAFPRGTHDDVVDSCASAYARLLAGSADRFLTEAAPECPKCQGPNVAGSLSCRWCGAKLRETMGA